MKKINIANIEKATVLAKCPKCGNQVVTDREWYPGGCNDYGSFEVECLKCHEIFDIYVGRDVDASRIEFGAKLINMKYKD